MMGASKVHIATIKENTNRVSVNIESMSKNILLIHAGRAISQGRKLPCA